MTSTIDGHQVSKPNNLPILHQPASAIENPGQDTEDKRKLTNPQNQQTPRKPGFLKTISSKLLMMQLITSTVMLISFGALIGNLFSQTESTAIEHAMHVSTVISDGIIELNEITGSDKVTFQDTAKLQEWLVGIYQRTGHNMMVLNSQKLIVADTQSKYRGLIYTSDSSDQVQLTLQDNLPRTFIEKTSDHPEGIRQLVLPLIAQTGETVGVIIYDYTPFFKIEQETTYKLIGVFSFLFLLGAITAIGMSTQLSHVIVPPLNDLIQAAKKLGAGDLQIEILAHGDDEISELASSFNDMRINLLRSYQTQEREIEQRKQAEEKFRNTIENAMEGVFQSTPDGRFLSVNGAMARIFGYTSPDDMIEIVGNNIPTRIYVDPKSREKFSHTLTELGMIKNFEALNFQKDGSQIWTLTNARAVRDDFGHVAYYEGFTVDITERKMSGEKLFEKEKRFRNLFENSPISLWEEDFSGVMARIEELRLAGITNFRSYLESNPEEIVNFLGRVKIINVNEETLKLYGAKSKDIFVDSLKNFLGGEMLTAFKEEVIAYSEGRTRFEFEGSDQKLNGEHIQVAIRAFMAPTKSETPYRLFVAISDITKQKQAELAMQLSNNKLIWTVDELETYNRQMTVLSEMGNLFQACKSEDEAYPIIAQFVAKLFPAESGILYIVKGSHDSLDVMSTWGNLPAIDSPFQPKNCWGLRMGRQHTSEAASNGITCPHLNHLTPLASLCIPLVASGDILGVLTLLANESAGSDKADATKSQEWFTVSKRKLATSVTEHIALALANLKMRDMLHKQAVRDHLTNLYNRRYMESALEIEINRAKHNGTPLGIIMLDIDHFKLFNDNFGHEAGDIILHELGAYLKSQIRSEDIACRYGGEEFTLIFPGSSLINTQQRANRLREGAKKLHATSNGKVLNTITLSLGVSEYPENGQRSEQLLRAADLALYRAKTNGRDRVEVALPEENAGE